MKTTHILQSLISDSFDTVEDFGLTAHAFSKCENGSDDFNAVKTTVSKKYLLVKSMVKNGLPLNTPYVAIKDVLDLAVK